MPKIKIKSSHLFKLKNERNSFKNEVHLQMQELSRARNALNGLQKAYQEDTIILQNEVDFRQKILEVQKQELANLRADVSVLDKRNKSLVSQNEMYKSDLDKLRDHLRTASDKLDKVKLIFGF